MSVIKSEALISPETELQLRLYQEEIIEFAKTSNTIAFLPTGSGKTLIACHVIVSRIRVLRQEGSKKFIAFVCPKKVLLGQQLEYVQRNCGQDKIRVKELTGELYLNSKSSSFWYNAKWEVCFMTPDVMRHLLDQKIVPISAFDMVIFDECHYIGMGNDPMARLCDSVCCNNTSSYVPLIMGLTASPIATKKGTAMEKMKYLESKMKSKFYVPSDASIAVLRQTINKPQVFMYVHKSITALVDIERDELKVSTVRVENLKVKKFQLAQLARLRLQHCCYITEIHDTLKTIKSSPSKFKSLTPLYMSGNLGGENSMSFTYIQCIDKIYTLIHQILKVTDECGVYCGLIAMEIGLKPLQSASSCRSLKVLLNDQYWSSKQSNNNKSYSYTVKSSATDATAFDTRVMSILRGPFLSQLREVLYNQQDSINASLLDVFIVLLSSLNDDIISKAFCSFQKSLKLMDPQYVTSGSIISRILKFFIENSKETINIDHIDGNCVLSNSSEETIVDISSINSCCDLMKCLNMVSEVLTSQIALVDAVKLLSNSFTDSGEATSILPLLSHKAKNFMSIWQTMTEPSVTRLPTTEIKQNVFFLSSKPDSGLSVFRPLNLGSWNDIKFSADASEVNSTLVFGEMRLVAETLCILFKNIATCWNKNTNLPPCPIVPECIHGDMTPEMQRDVLFKMKKKEINVLFATAIAEEGLDVQSCQLIVNFDGAPKTVKSYIQRRGRARHKNSVMFSLIGDAEVQLLGGDLLNFVQQEKELDKQLGEFLDSLVTLGDMKTSSSESAASATAQVTRAEPVPPVSSNQEFRYATKTGAFVDGLSATQLISSYCNAIGHRKDEYFDPQPLFAINKTNINPATGVCSFSCSLLLPTGTPPGVRCTVAEAKNKRDAKGAACVVAVRQLHLAGELNDNLCVPVENTGSCHHIYEATRHLCDVMKTIEIKTTPNSVNIKAIEVDEGTELHMYVVRIESVEDVDMNCFHTWNYLRSMNLMGMAVRFQLPEDIVSYRIKLSIRLDAKCEVSVNYLGKRVCSKEELYHMERFHCAVTADDVMRKYQLVTRVKDIHSQYLPPECDLTANTNDHFEYESRDGYVTFPVPLIDETNVLASQVDKEVYSDQDLFLKFLIHNADEASKFAHNLSLIRQGIIKAKSPSNYDASCHRSGFPRSTYQLDGTFDHSQYTGLIVVNQKKELLLCLPLSDDPTTVKTLNDPMIGYVRVESAKKKQKVETIQGIKSIAKVSPEYVEDGEIMEIEATKVNETENKSKKRKFSIVSNDSTEEEIQEVVGDDTSTLPDNTVSEMQSVAGGTFLDHYRKFTIAGVVQKLSFKPDHKMLRVYMLQIKDQRTSLLTEVKREKPPCVIYAVPELCSIVGHCRWYYLPLIAPSVMHRIKSLLLAADVRTQLNEPLPDIPLSFNPTTCPNLGLLQESMTHVMCVEGFNSERLEMLGDNFLKFSTALLLCQQHPTKNEGFLHHAQQKIVSNLNLCRMSEKFGIARYLRCLPHYGPELNAGYAKDRFQPISKSIRYKSLADMLESIIAAYYLDGGIDAGIHAMAKLGLVDPRVSESLPNVMSTAYVPPTIPSGYDEWLTQMALGTSENNQNDSEAQDRSNFKYCHLTNTEIECIESIFSYRFKNYDLLSEALTHPSVQFKKSYQRLEFLGDAVLDFIVINRVYAEKMDLREGGLTSYKMSVVCNKNLAKFTRKHLLYRYLYTHTVAMHELFSNLLEDTEMVMELGESSCKLLGDICESIIGAIYVDSGGDLSVLYPVVDEITKQCA